MRRILALLGLACCCAPVAADQVDLGFNSDALRLVYVHEFRDAPLQIDGGLLYHSDNGEAVHVGVNLVDVASSGSRELVGGLGGRLVYQNGDLSSQDGFAIPVGGFLAYTPQRFNRFTLSVAGYFAPSILTIGDTEQYHDYSVRLAYNVMRQADVYIGARYVRGDYDNAPDAYFDTGMHVGLTLRF